MPNINLSRKLDAHKKRDISVAAIEVDLNKAVNDHGAVQGDVLQLVALPKNSVVIGLSAVLQEVADVAVTVTPNPGAGGGVIAAMNVGTGGAPAAAVGDNESYDFMTDNTLGLTNTGVIVSLELTTLAASLTKGRMLILVQYIEYTKTDGELTEFVE